MNIRIKLIDESIEAPSYAHFGDAGMDLRSAVDAEILPGSRELIPCGFAIEIPDGYAGYVIPRSGLAIKHGISVVNAPGLIDSGYRGEIKVILLNTDQKESFKVAKGDRIAQLMIVAYPSVELTVVDELSESQRGEGGFGSSGV